MTSTEEYFLCFAVAGVIVAMLWIAVLSSRIQSNTRTKERGHEEKQEA